MITGVRQGIDGRYVVRRASQTLTSSGLSTSLDREKAGKSHHPIKARQISSPTMLKINERSDHGQHANLSAFLGNQSYGENIPSKATIEGTQ